MSQLTMSKIQSNGPSLESASDDSEATRRFNYFKFKNQFFAAIVVCLSAFSLGNGAGYTSPTMDAIQRRFTLDEQEVSLVISLSSIAAIPAGFVGGAAADYFGRKLALMMNGALCAISWLLLISAQNVAMLYAGRFVSGFTVAVTCMCAPVYITEISSPEIRGILGACFQLSICLGVLYSYLLGAYISWRWLTVACLAVNAVQIVLILFLPETPTWLARHNLNDAETSALVWLNRSKTENDENKSVEKQSVSENKITLKSFTDPALLKPTLILCTQMFIQQFSGSGVVILYAVSIFQSATDAIDPHMSANIVAGSTLLACCVALVLVDKLGRKILLIISAIFMAVGMISLGAFYYAQATDVNSVEHILWLPIVSLVICEFAYGIGYGPVPWLMMGEVFPNHARGVASGIVTTFAWTTAFIMAKSFPDMKNTMKDYGAFWFFGAVSVFAVFFSYFIVPETKGKTLDEIEVYFKRRKSKEMTVEF